MKIVKEKEVGIIPGKISPRDFFDAYITGNGYFSDFYSYIYSRWDNKVIEPELMYALPEFQTAFEMYKDLRDNDIVSDYKFDYLGFIGNGVIASDLENILIVNKYYGSFTSSFKFQMYPLYMDSNYLNIPPGINSLGINVNSDNADRILKFVEWVQSSQENYDLFMYGIKDKNYKLSGNTIDFSLSKTLGSSILNWPGSEVFRNFQLDRPYPFEPEDYVEFRKDNAFKNTILYTDLYDYKGYNESTYKTLTQDEMTKEYVKIDPYLTKINNEYNNYLDMLAQGSNTEITFEQIVEEKGLQPDIDKILDFCRFRLDQMKK